MRRPAQLETGWSHLGHKELGSWSLLVSMGGAGQRGQGGHVLWGTQKEMRTSRENAEVVSRKNLLTLVLSALNL